MSSHSLDPRRRGRAAATRSGAIASKTLVEGPFVRIRANHTMLNGAHACDRAAGLLSWRSANDNKKHSIGLGPPDLRSEGPRKVRVGRRR